MSATKLQLISEVPQSLGELSTAQEKWPPCAGNTVLTQSASCDQNVAVRLPLLDLPSALLHDW